MRMAKHKGETQAAANWIDTYAPADSAEADYFYGRATSLPVVAPGAARKKPGRTIKVLAGAVAAIGLLGLTGFYKLQQLHSTAPPPASARTATEQTKAAGERAGAARTLKQYNSAALQLRFSYPSAWQLHESPGVVSVRSPVTNLPLASGALAPGSVELSIETGHTTPTPDRGETAVAAQPSQPFTYSAPGPAQRASSYLSFVRFSGSPAESIDAIYVTGAAAYRQAEPIPTDSLAVADPLVSVRFWACPPSGNCLARVQPLAVSTQLWQSSSYADDITAIVASLTVL